MQPRLDYSDAAPGALKAMSALDKAATHCGLESTLLDLIKLRASQINGCAYCVDMHSKDLRAAGESEQRVYSLSVWRETPFYSERERAALAFTEAVTLIAADGHVTDQVYEAARAHFSEEELVNLVLNIVTINAWNRFCITFRDEVGIYQPKLAASAA